MFTEWKLGGTVVQALTNFAAFAEGSRVQILVQELYKQNRSCHLIAYITMRSEGALNSVFYAEASERPTQTNYYKTHV